jgi:hypothetical protein
MFYIRNQNSLNKKVLNKKMKAKHILQFIFTLALSVLIFQSSFAQFCIDSSKINLQFQCPDASYKPVCACDGKTYRNICSAEMQNGILQGQWRDGSCSGLEFDIYPTITNDNLNFSFVQLQNNAATAELYIVDQYGAIMYYKSLYVDPSFCDGFSCKSNLLITETAYYRQGVYIMFLFNGKGDYRFKKFIKY